MTRIFFFSFSLFQPFCKSECKLWKTKGSAGPRYLLSQWVYFCLPGRQAQISSCRLSRVQPVTSEKGQERPWLAQAHRQAAWENTTLKRLPEVPGDKTAILKWHQTKLEMEGRHTLPRFLNTKKAINQKQGLLKYKNGPLRLLTGRTLTHRPDDPSLTFGSHKVTG